MCRATSVQAAFSFPAASYKVFGWTEFSFSLFQITCFLSQAQIYKRRSCTCIWWWYAFSLMLNLELKERMEMEDVSWRISTQGKEYLSRPVYSSSLMVVSLQGLGIISYLVPKRWIAIFFVLLGMCGSFAAGTSYSYF